MLHEENRKSFIGALKYHWSEFAAAFASLLAYVLFGKDFEWGMPKVALIACFTIAPIISICRVYISTKKRKYIDRA